MISLQQSLTTLPVLPLCSSILRHPQTATGTGLRTSLHTNLLTSGSATWSQWIGGMSFGSMRVSLHGLDGSPLITCTQVSSTPHKVEADLTIRRLECVGSVRCTFKSTRYHCSANTDVVCRLIPCNKLSHSMRYALPIPSKYLSTMVLRLIRSSITSATCRAVPSFAC
jgi:hypothetical protein